MTRDERLIACFAVLASLAAGLVGVDILTPVKLPTEAVLRDVDVGADGVLSIQFVGDTMPGGPLQSVIDQRGYAASFGGVRARTEAEDFVVAAGAAPITDMPATGLPGRALTTRSAGATALAQAGVDALSLVDGQVLGSGPQGLADTLRHAEATGLATVGAGADLARAQQPLLLRTALGTVGVVAFGKGAGDRAGEGAPGLIVLSSEAILRQRDLARAAGADWVVGVVHWGTGYSTVQPEQRVWAAEFAAADYALVVGSGPHIAQPIELIGGMPVAFSLGNFVYGTKGRFDEIQDRGFGLAVSLKLAPRAAPSVVVRCLLANNRVTGFQPRYCDAAQSATYLPVLGDLRVEGDLAVLQGIGAAR